MFSRKVTSRSANAINLNGDVFKVDLNVENGLFWRIVRGRKCEHFIGVTYLPRGGWALMRSGGATDVAPEWLKREFEHALVSWLFVNWGRDATLSEVSAEIEAGFRHMLSTNAPTLVAHA